MRCECAAELGAGVLVRSQASVPGVGQQAPEPAELTQLRREVVRLKMEPDILRTATALFAKEPVSPVAFELAVAIA